MTRKDTNVAITVLLPLCSIESINTPQNRWTRSKSCFWKKVNTIKVVFLRRFPQPFLSDDLFAKSLISYSLSRGSHSLSRGYTSCELIGSGFYSLMFSRYEKYYYQIRTLQNAHHTFWWRFSKRVSSCLNSCIFEKKTKKLNCITLGSSTFALRRRFFSLLS